MTQHTLGEARRPVGRTASLTGDPPWPMTANWTRATPCRKGRHHRVQGKDGRDSSDPRRGLMVGGRGWGGKGRQT